MLAVLGDLVEDVVVWLDEDLRTGTDTSSRVFRTRGGSGANVAAFAAAAGTPTRFLGCVGDDRLGAALVDGMTVLGVDVRVERRGSTGTVVVLIDASSERTMLPDRAAARELRTVPDEWLDDVSLLHVSGYAFADGPAAAAALDAARRARARGALTSVDVASTGMMEHYGVDEFHRLLVDLAPDVLLANADEAACLGLLGPGRGGLDATTVVVKAGADPTTVLAPGADPLVVPVPPVADVRDSTGAGDAFAAGFLGALIDGADLRGACERAHASAARVLANPGATHA
ncbi:carbohydrate kinase family protein [Cellulomonas sp. HZM]|uniref:carbohydrate kinase family protein n=1 Tax=Cellulomonas sp. HZM TaxID=1454010 RepID=UPI0004930145|nr:PfkB family carbohydrate kinase [Cellulomonas sp. HZM]